ncbi:MAG: endonuclease III [Termitinemataceae bacterium]|nr:MAG: endonuclease III [Termitinemataceae bacterium]
MTGKQFRKRIYQFYEKSGRDFPWRSADASPWGILVSEFMLQQTQTSRVCDYWKHWLELWPHPADFAGAPLSHALREWSGLGYNRRCLNLHKTAAIIAEEHGGIVPRTPEDLQKLPGIGAYTAGAIACFAYQHSSVFIETNIRAALIHCFFSNRMENPVHDDELVPILDAALDRANPRLFYWALMDYGAALKKAGQNAARNSVHYTRQSRFEGSFRQKRGALLRSLSFSGPADTSELQKRTGIEPEVIYEVMESLKTNMMVAELEGVYMVKD